jgi:hypothetical protein
MWYIIVGICLSVSALFGIVFWFALIAARRSDERNAVDFSEHEPEDTSLHNTAK